MSRFTFVAALVVLLALATAACAEVTITSPTENTVVGPSTAITGQASQRAFLVIYSEVTTADGVELTMVPGLRHWTNDNNSYGVRISTPRIYSAPNEELTYTIHVKAYSQAPASIDAPADLGEAQVTVTSR